MSDQDQTIAALIAQVIEAFNVCELWLANSLPTCDLPNPKPLPVLRAVRAKLEAAGLESALRAVTPLTWECGCGSTNSIHHANCWECNRTRREGAIRI